MIYLEMNHCQYGKFRKRSWLTLRLQVFRGGIEKVDAEKLINDFKVRKKRGLYFYPDLNRAELLPCFHELSKHTEVLGCRTLDILHVCCAVLIKANQFVAFDVKQSRLASLAGLELIGLEKGD